MYDLVAKRVKIKQVHKVEEEVFEAISALHAVTEPVIERGKMIFHILVRSHWKGAEESDAYTDGIPQIQAALELCMKLLK